jgi:nitroreductase
MTTDVLTSSDLQEASFGSPPAPSATEFLASRRSVSAFQLVEPGPSDGELHDLLTLAARTPDHGALVPWRFIVLPKANRQDLADRLIAAFRAEFTGAAADLEPRAERLTRFFIGPPTMVVVVSRINTASQIPAWEQHLCAGAVCMNLLHAAHAHGLGANWLTGWAAGSPRGNAILGLSEAETIAGLIPIGTIQTRPADRPRPKLADIVSHWTPNGGTIIDPLQGRPS